MSAQRTTLNFDPLRQLPTKWAVGAVVILIGYALLQPQLNQRLGWNLPSLASWQQGDQTTAKATSSPKSGNATGDKDSTSNKSTASKATRSTKNGAVEVEKDVPPQDSTSAAAPLASSKSTKSTQPPAQSKKPAAASNAATENELRYGLLRETAPDDFLSPGGLRYTRGSAEGHRLNHIQRHLEDDPDRPGKHGVFDGDMAQVLRWLDEAYALGKRGAKGTKTSAEDGRTVYEVNFSKPVGYIGGRDGARSNHPDSRRIRLVVDGNKVITAFPF